MKWVLLVTFVLLTPLSHATANDDADSKKLLEAFERELGSKTVPLAQEELKKPRGRGIIPKSFRGTPEQYTELVRLSFREARGERLTHSERRRVQSFRRWISIELMRSNASMWQALPR